jgi:hypothetical protein
MALKLSDGLLVQLLSASMALVTLLCRRDSITALSCCGGSSISQIPAQWKITKCATIVGDTIGPNKFFHQINEILVQSVK